MSTFPVVSLGHVGGAEVQTVNARDLHAFLQVGKDFSTWIKDRVEQYGFTEDADFVKFEDVRSPTSGSSKSRAQTAIEYAITIDMAKELSMVERNDQGKRARQYFIDCERRAKDPREALNHVPTLRQLLLDNVEKVLELERQVEDLRPSREAIQRIAEADGSLCITEAAKALQMRPKDLFSWLRHNGWVYRRSGSGHDLGYQSKTASGLLEHKVTTVLRADGSEKITEQVRVTPKGLTKLAPLIKPAVKRVA